MLNVDALGKNIEELRRERGLTQKELAAAISVSFQAVSNWERGIAPPELGNLIAIADYFGVTIDELVRDDSGKELFIGVDGGGTKTELCLVCADGTVLARRSACGSNPNDVGYAGMFSLLSSEIGKFFTEFKSIRGIFLGISGITTGDNQKRLIADLGARYPRVKIEAKSDSACLFAFDERAEMAVISGTGSVVFVKCEDGFRRLGGWGHLLDNAGSAYDIGKAALRRALYEEERSLPYSRLTTLLLEKLGTKTVWERINTIYSEGKPYIASLASAVFEAYRAGDEHAIKIIDENAKALAGLLSSGISLFGAVPVAVASGGIFEHYREIMLEHIAKYADIEITVSDLPPIFGASKNAVSLVCKPTADFYFNFKKSYAKLKK